MRYLTRSHNVRNRTLVTYGYQWMAIFMLMLFALVVGLEGACVACELEENEHPESSMDCACLCHIPPSVLSGNSLPAFMFVPARLVSSAEGTLPDTPPSEIFHPPKDLS